jgi:GNAT superfamily N-acetyltransferase
MTENDGLEVRPARPGDGQAVFDVTHRSVGGLATQHYSPEQIAGWMGERTAEFYEGLIANGRMVVAVHDQAVVGFVDADPGEVTRLFILPEAAGAGIGKRLLDIGIDLARKGHSGPIRLEATLNAEGFYQRHGFVTVDRGTFSHGLGGDPIPIVHMELR